VCEGEENQQTEEKEIQAGCMLSESMEYKIVAHRSAVSCYGEQRDYR